MVKPYMFAYGGYRCKLSTSNQKKCFRALRYALFSSSEKAGCRPLFWKRVHGLNIIHNCNVAEITAVEQLVCLFPDKSELAWAIAAALLNNPKYSIPYSISSQKARNVLTLLTDFATRLPSTTHMIKLLAYQQITSFNLSNVSACLQIFPTISTLKIDWSEPREL